MHIVDQIAISGFRGIKSDLKLDLHQGVNFIIGRNGTGKTSLINLINAALSGDSRLLLSSFFDEIKIKLRAKGSSARPVVTVRKEIDQESDNLEVVYYIQNKSSEKPIRHTFRNEGHFPRSMNLMMRRKYLATLGTSYTNFLEQGSPVKEELDRLVTTSWLSVHRMNWRGQDSEPKKFQSPVDQKLEEVSTKFGAYLSTLDKHSADETDRFQTAYFLSLISPPKIAAMSEDLAQISAAAERDALKEMFSEFKLKQSARSLTHFLNERSALSLSMSATRQCRQKSS